jgi:nucleotide-binding universal stress UspA family protein
MARSTHPTPTPIPIRSAPRHVPGRILAAIDLDDVGMDTLRIAHARAQAARGRLAVCHVVHDVPSEERLRTEALAAARDLVSARLQAELGERADDVDVFVADGDAAVQITATADGWSADLIVVGRPHEHAGAIRRAISPGVVDNVVHHARCSVLVSRRAPGTGRILAAVEAETESATDVLRAAAAEQINKPGSHLYVVHCVAPMAVVAPTGEGMVVPVVAWDDVAAASRRRIFEIMGRAGVVGEVKIVPYEPADGVLDLARELAIDLIVVGTHDRGRLSRLILGSVSDKMAHDAPCSVLVIKLPAPSPN